MTGELIVWMVVGFLSGSVLCVIGLYLISRQPKNVIGRAVRRIAIKALHGLTDAEAREVSAILFGGQRVDSEKIDRRVGPVYAGPCACGCGQEMFYSGRGKRPKYVNRKHLDFARGFRVSWE